MITINQIKTEIAFDKSSKKLVLKDLLDSMDVLHRKAAKALGINVTEIEQVSILKHSIDARKKPTLYQVYTLGVVLKNSKQEEKIVKRCKNNNVALQMQREYTFPQSGDEVLKDAPVIIGMGPAGLFCGYMLAKYGYRPILLERGCDVDTRKKDVEEYWNGGKLNR